MSNKSFWIPRRESECAAAWTVQDRPGANTVMFFNDINTTSSALFTDHYTGNAVNFGQTLTGSDNRLENMTHVWRQNSSFGRTWAYTKNTGYISWHLGAVPQIHPASSIRSYSQHLLPSYVGLRFQYRWPYNNDVNYWSNSPVHINDMMLHYYNASNGEFWSYAAQVARASSSNTDYWPDRCRLWHLSTGNDGLSHGST